MINIFKIVFVCYSQRLHLSLTIEKCIVVELIASFYMADSVIISDYRKFIMNLDTRTKNWQSELFLYSFHIVFC